MISGPSPSLVVSIDGQPPTTLSTITPFPSRHWLLGVVAVQAGITDGVVCARLRIHRTLSPAPLIVPLSERALIQVVCGGEIVIPPPALQLEQTLGTAAAQLVLCIDDEVVARASLARDRVDAQPPVRAFSHVYCRWLRDGASELGCDLTDFLSLPEGARYERLVTHTLRVGQTVSISWASATRRMTPGRTAGSTR